MDAVERHDWLEGLAWKTFYFYEDPDLRLQGNHSLHYSARDPNQMRRQLLNGHTITPYSGVGVAAEVMRAEMCGPTVSCSSTLWTEMWTDSQNAVLDAEAELGTDGASHNGVYYAVDYLGELLKYNEAVHSRWSTHVWSNDWYDNAGRYVDHFTLPNAHRSWMADGFAYDQDGPSWQLGLLATDGADDATQYLAWLGHNDISYGGVDGRRTSFDVLFWDPGLDVIKTADHDADTHPHRCFEDREIVSLRTGWGDDATWLGFDAGPRDGGHGDPAAGDLEMYRAGYLLAGDGDNNTKRTAARSVFLVGRSVSGGHVDVEQHGDGRDSTDPVPEDGSSPGIQENNAEVICFLDNTSDAAGVDFVTVGADVTQMYRYDDLTDDAPYSTSVDADPPLESVRKLSALERYLVWSGGDVLVYDRYEVTGSSPTFDMTSMFSAAEIDPGSGARASCPTAAAILGGSPYFAHVSGGTTKYLKYLDYGDGLTYWYDSSAGSSAMQEFNAYTPSGCDSGTPPNPWTGSGASWTVDAAGSGGGHLQVTVLDPWSSGMDDVYTSIGNGGTIVGEQLRRTQSRSGGGFFLTALRPYVGSTAPTAPTASALANGTKVTVPNTDGSKYLLALFATPGATSVSDGSGNQTDGYLGSVLYSSSSQQTRSAASMVEGNVLTSTNQILVDVTGNTKISIGLTYESDTIWGTIDIPDGQSSVTVWVWGNGSTPASGVHYRGVGSPSPVGLSGTVTSGGVSFTVAADGQFQIDLSGTPSPKWNLTECSGD